MQETKKLSPHVADSRKTERGAALLTMLMISMLLLAAGGALVMTTGVSNTTAIDSTAEIQAYYGAEAGLQAALNVLRGNVSPGAGLANGTKMGFRNAVTANIAGRLAGKPAGVTNLSSWLAYGNDGRITLNNNFLNYTAYTLDVSDADDPNGVALADATYIPRRLLVRSTGFGPKGATKRMEMMIQRVDLNFTERSMLLIRSADPDPATGITVPSNIAVGSSNAKNYSGKDSYGTSNIKLPTFGVTSNADIALIDAESSGNGHFGNPRFYLVPPAELPPWLLNADAARAFLNDFEEIARANGSYHGGNYTGTVGSNNSPAFAFIDGDANIEGGAGLLIVTGNLIFNGNDDFQGIMLVLGGGSYTRGGGGNGNTLGTFVVARFARTWPAAENNQPHPFLPPTFNTGGGGTGDMLYNSDWVRKGRNVLGTRVRDVREY
ncbi:MAG TPA: hypothetical protein VF658_02185 [Pyrinomonadaceae bacterium]|jgi:hypothetical protein